MYHHACEILRNIFKHRSIDVHSSVGLYIHHRPMEVKHSVKTRPLHLYTYVSTVDKYRILYISAKTSRLSLATRRKKLNIATMATCRLITCYTYSRAYIQTAPIALCRYSMGAYNYTSCSFLKTAYLELDIY
jgi:hypothetical protein